MRLSWSILVFLSVVLLVSGLIHFFLYRGLVRGLGITTPGTLWLLRSLAVLLAVSYPLARFLSGSAPDFLVAVAHWSASVWLGLMFHLLWAGLLLALAKLALRITGVWSRLEAHHALLGRAAVIAVAATALVLGVRGVFGAYRPARVRTAWIPVKSINPELERLRIALVADFHAGVVFSRREVDRRVAEVNALGPDLILIPGDIIDHPPERASKIAEAFGRLRARLGVFASTGNHEYIVGRKRGVEFLERAGMRVLANEHVELPGGLVLAGIEDASAPRFGGSLAPMKAVLGPEATTNAAILLNHTPGSRAAREAVAAGADLVVSGHTHGGQIWPWSRVTRLVFPLHHGIYRVGPGTQLTTCGIGFWGPPMRLGADPEIWLIRLVGRGEAEEHPADRRADTAD